MEEASSIKDNTMLWEGSGSLWNMWMNMRYIKGHALDKIQPSSIDSQIGEAYWQGRLAEMGMCEILGTRSSLQWKGDEDKTSTHNKVSTSQTEG